MKDTAYDNEYIRAKKADVPMSDEIEKNDPRYFEMRRMYIENNALREWQGGQSGKGIRAPSQLAPAFDRRAIDMHGKPFLKPWWHLGRKKYYDPADVIFDDMDRDEDIAFRQEINGIGPIIGPSISTRGIAIYIIEKVIEAMSNYEYDKNELVKMVDPGNWYDYGPRKFNAPGSVNPLEISPNQLVEANKSIQEPKKSKPPVEKSKVKLRS